MSKAQRLAVRNAKIAQSQAEKKTKDPVIKQEPTQQEVKAKLRQLMEIYIEAEKKTKAFMKRQGVDEDMYIDSEAASYIKQESQVVEEKSTSTLRFMPARTIRGKTSEEHFAGFGSTAVNNEYQKFKLVETKAYNAYLAYRSSYDKEWIASQKENQVKSNVVRKMLGKEIQQPKKKLLEVIHQMHSNPLDTSSYIMCRHYDRDTWDPMDCDCEHTYKCGCVEACVCSVHDVSLCDCPTMQRMNKKTVSKCREHTQDPTSWLQTSDVVSIKPSLRTFARLTRDKAALEKFGTTKIKVVRNSAGSILIKNADGKMNEAGVRCCHSIIPTGDILPCDCLRDENNQLQLSEKMRKLPKDDVVLDETYLNLQRQLVSQSAAETEYFLNPSGFAGSLRPNYGPVHPLKLAQEEAMVAQAVKMQLLL